MRLSETHPGSATRLAKPRLVAEVVKLKWRLEAGEVERAQASSIAAEKVAAALSSSGQGEASETTTHERNFTITRTLAVGSSPSERLARFGRTESEREKQEQQGSSAWARLASPTRAL
jgi:hypothetical protein